MTTITGESLTIDEWLTIYAFIDKHPQFHLGQLRWLLRNRRENGLNKAIRKIGRNLYLNETLFSEWIFNHGQTNSPSY
jgi:ribosomal 50S subunit-associated protein YjgA (DUF615 family)